MMVSRFKAWPWWGKALLVLLLLSLVSVAVELVGQNAYSSAAVQRSAVDPHLLKAHSLFEAGHLKRARVQLNKATLATTATARGEAPLGTGVHTAVSTRQFKNDDGNGPLDVSVGPFGFPQTSPPAVLTFPSASNPRHGTIAVRHIGSAKLKTVVGPAASKGSKCDIESAKYKIEQDVVKWDLIRTEGTVLWCWKNGEVTKASDMDMDPHVTSWGKFVGFDYGNVIAKRGEWKFNHRAAWRLGTYEYHACLHAPLPDPFPGVDFDCHDYNHVIRATVFAGDGFGSNSSFYVDDD